MTPADLIARREALAAHPAVKRVEVIGGQTLILGDCLEVMPLLGRFDAVVTDPPYGIDGGSGGDARDFAKAAYSGAFEDTPEYIASVCVPIIKAAIQMAEAVVLTPGIRCIGLYPQPRDMGCFWTPAAVTHGPWGMTVMQPILFYGKDWRAGKGAWPAGRQVTERAEKNGHPCPKPILAWQWLIEKAVPPHGACLDPFMGSGTTLVACQKLGRLGTGIEIDPEYWTVACERVHKAWQEPDMFVEQAAPKAQQMGMFDD